MARDYRYGAPNKKGFQRRSQQQDFEQEAGGQVSKQLWLLGISLGLVMIATYFIVSHFLSGQSKASQTPTFVKESQEAKSSKPKGWVVEAVNPINPSPSEMSVSESAADAGVPATALADKIEYTFYQGLAKTEVIVDAEPLPIKLPQPFYIQAGSFGKKSVAEKEQARLARWGFQTELSALQGKKRVYYRLRLGPFTDRLQMNKVRNQLRRKGVDTLLIKAPKTSSSTTASVADRSKP